MKKTLSIKYFSILSDIAGRRQEEITTKQHSTLQQILDELTSRFPDMKKYHPHIRAAVNQQYEELDYLPADKDEIVFITPVSGG